MQNMPAKTRTALTVGAVLLVAIVGAVALYASRGKAPTAQNSSDAQVTQEAAGTQPQESATNPINPAMTAIEEGSESTGASGTHTDGTAATDPTSGTAGTAAGTDAMSPLEDGNAPTTAGAEVPETYTVAPGDSLRTIALQFYGDPVYSADIENLNELPDPDHITVGQVLKMPALDDVKQH